MTRYRYISKLGVGGMARVDLAEDTILGRPVALKRIAGPPDEDGLSRLRREALAGASLNHPNLVAIYDVVTPDEGELVMVMEYVAGGTLRDALKQRGSLPPGEAMRVLGGVAAGLDAIHGRGIVHRDVKPSNILLGDGGAVKVADLGVAAIPDRTRITTAGSVVGSLSYMAPEQLENAPSTPAIDVYALAAVAFEMLSGEKARQELNPVTLAHAMATAPPPDLRSAWPDAPAGAADRLVQGMARDPADRPRTAGELVRRLGDALAVEPTTRLARRPVAPAPVAAAPVAAAPAARARATSAGRAGHRAPPPPIARRDPNRPRRGALVAALLAVLAGVVILLVLLSSGSSGPRSRPRQATHPAAHRQHHAAAARPATASSTTTSSTSSAAAPAVPPPASATSSTAASSTTPTSPAPAAPAAAAAPAGSPVGTVESFYSAAAAHRYASAWALADPTMRAQLGGYPAFEQGQAGDRSITFNSARVVNQSSRAATVAIQTTSVRDNGTQHCAGTVNLVPTAGQWRMHLIDINCH